MRRRAALLVALAAACLCVAARAEPVAQTGPQQLVAAARKQVGVTVAYDPNYTKIAFPMGDVPRERGVCTDVIVRAYRDALGVDLQALVNRDMRGNFKAYPHNWGLPGPDASIDHRRVPNLQTFFARQGASLPVTTAKADYLPGDVVSQMLPGHLPHIVIVSDEKGATGAPLVIHNIGRGAKEEDSLFEYEVTGHYRYAPPRQ